MNDEVPRDGKGYYLPRIHNTPKLKKLVKDWMDDGVDDTEIGLRLMWHENYLPKKKVKIYYAVRLIQKERKIRKDKKEVNEADIKD